MIINHPHGCNNEHYLTFTEIAKHKRRRMCTKDFILAKTIMKKRKNDKVQATLQKKRMVELTKII